MKPKQIEQWLAALGSKAETAPSQEWIHGKCPFAEWTHEKGVDTRPSFGVKIGSGDCKCYCLACGEAGSQYEVMLRLRHRGLGFDFNTAAELVYAAEDDEPLSELPEPYEDAFLAKEFPHLYPEWLCDAFEPAYHEGAVHPYLESRGMPYDIAEKLDMRFDVFRLRVLFPIRDWRKRLRGLHGRAICFPCGGDTWEQNLPYKMYSWQGQTNAHIWLGEQWADPDRPIIVAESVFDLARVLEVYDNVISPLTATVSAPKVARLKNASRVITLFDGDKAGERARVKLNGGLPTTKLTHIKLPPGTDAGEHSPDEIWELIEHLV